MSINRHNWWKWALLGAGTALYVIGKSQQARERQPSAVEAIEQPECVEVYGRIMRMPPQRYLRAWLACRALNGLREARVLDVGCGTGTLALEFARRKQVATVTGVDLSAEMIAHARFMAERRGCARATFLQADATALPFPDAAFDVVVSTLALHHIDRAEDALREMARVLAPGGRVLVVDLRRDASPFVLGASYLVTRFLLPEPLRRKGEPIGSFRAAFTPCEAVLLAARAGWEEPRVVPGPFWLALTMEKER